MTPEQVTKYDEHKNRIRDILYEGLEADPNKNNGLFAMNKNKFRDRLEAAFNFMDRLFINELPEDYMDQFEQSQTKERK